MKWLTVPKFVGVHNLSRETSPLTVQYCTSFATKLRGLTFRRDLAVDQGILLVLDQPGRLNSAIHSLFMRFDFTVVWLNQDLVVVDRQLARPWRPLFISRRPARFVLELASSRQEDFRPGELLGLTELLDEVARHPPF